MYHINILALSGSLRALSYNTAALNALTLLSPETVHIQIFKEIACLPLFNPDLNEETTPYVKKLKSALRQSQGIIIASPEYAHGISGVLKNALDWLVSGEEFINMPVAFINTSPRAEHGMSALREVITTMSGNIIEEACIDIPLLGSHLTAKTIIENHSLASQLQSGLMNFCQSLKTNEFTN